MNIYVDGGTTKFGIKIDKNRKNFDISIDIDDDHIMLGEVSGYFMEELKDAVNKECIEDEYI